MTDPKLTVTVLRAPAEPVRVAVLMPGLGTAVTGTWDAAAQHLDPETHVLALDLPGHGCSPAWRDDVDRDAEPSLAQLAHAVHTEVTEALKQTGLAGLPTHFAGISLAGALALQLGLMHAQAFSSVAVVCSAAKIGEPAAWRQRAAAVRTEGTEQLVEGSVARWFAPDFPEAQPAVVEELVSTLRSVDAESYARLCEALAGFDLTHRLDELTVPVLAIAGEHDEVTTPQDAAAIGSGVGRSEVHVLSGAAHQAPTERPEQVAALLNAAFA